MGAYACGLLDCLNAVEWGILVTVGTLALVWLTTKVVRYARVRRRRLAAGSPPVKWRAIARSRLTAPVLAGPEGDERLRLEAEEDRERAWARRQAMSEIAKHGRPVRYRWCPTHQRWCFTPDGGPHPPGGRDAPPVPADFHPPD